MSDVEEKTRVTSILGPQQGETSGRGDCLVTIYAKDPAQLGKRYVLEASPTSIGRGHDNHVVLESDSVSRRHCHIERRPATGWFAVDDGSTNGTYVNDDQISAPVRLRSGDRIKVGPTIFKYLSGTDVESLYHEEIYRITIIDGLTQAHNKRHLFEALEKEITRSRRYGRDLACIMFDIDHFKKINDTHGHLAGDYVLKEVARVVRSRLRGEETFARYGGEEFCIVAPETPIDGARVLAEDIRRRVAESSFLFQGEKIGCTISCGVAMLGENDKDGVSLIKAADEQLYVAKRTGRNRVVG
ncbi:MAG: GGDEF domain-containing protein [Sandaracinaceae bacterium]|nr:GGDEF domain-containing protein [Sandaracinaceae bacterium]